MKTESSIYNTQRDPLILKGYGRNVQKIVAYIRNEPDKKKRSEMAGQLVNLIRWLIPSEKEPTGNTQRIWDDLHIMANFDIDVDSPYSVPDKNILFKKPDRMSYPQGKIQFKRYGKNVERLIRKVSEKEKSEERERDALYVGRLMKTFHSSWNKGGLDDSVIIKDLQQISEGKIQIDPKKIEQKNLFEKLYTERKKPRNQNEKRDKRRDKKKNFSSGGFRRKKH